MSQISIEQALQVAIRHHRAGELGQAEQVYRKILSQVPNHPDALHLLGVLAGQAGQPDAGIELIQRAIALSPAPYSYHNNLGDLLMQKGRSDDALAAFRRALELHPRDAIAYKNMGHVLQQKGQLAEAIAAFQQAIQVQPDHADAHCNLGSALIQQRAYAAALPSLRRAVELNPQLGEAHSHLGTALKELGRIDEALASFRRAVALQPNHLELHNILGIMLASHGQLQEAIACFSHILQVQSADLNAHINLGLALSRQGRYPEAIACYRRALELKPDHAPAHFHLGLTLAASNQVDGAIAAYQNSIRLDSEYAPAYNQLGESFKDAGRTSEAVASYRQALEKSPDFVLAHSNLLYMLQFHPDCDATAIAREHERWEERHGQPLKKLITPHTRKGAPDRRLRVGYLSADFRDHVIGRNMMPLFREHDRAQVEIICYSNVRRPDAMTDQFRACAKIWRDIQSLTDLEAADLIRRDAIDILVDLNLHLADNRLLVFARKPAPVQLTFAGYPGTTGLSVVDYRLTDPYLDPLTADVSIYSEKSIRLPHTFWCYDPLGTDLPVNPLPAQSSGVVTFGCLNHFCKVNDRVLSLWARVLRAVPGAQLMMMALPGSHRQRTLDSLAAEGVPSERVKFVNPRPRLEYLALYHQLDICLDTFPCNGHTTSLDSMWMGVPVVTLVGQTVMGRAGLSQLTNMGLSELIAHGPEEYVRISSALAADLPRLADLRASLRQRMEESPLMNAPRFARNIEAAYRQVWRQWCETSQAASV